MIIDATKDIDIIAKRHTAVVTSGFIQRNTIAEFTSIQTKSKDIASHVSVKPAPCYIDYSLIGPLAIIKGASNREILSL